MNPLESSRLRRRLFWTAVLMLVALGGAGLATAADRPATDELRPELFARADRQAAEWLADMRAKLRTIDDRVSALAGSGRAVLGSLQRLEPGQISSLLGEGDTAAAELETAVALLADNHARPPAGLELGRMSLANRDLVAGVDRALASTIPLGASWRELSATARNVATLISFVFEHERLVFEATGAARDERWRAALDLLDEADRALVVAQAAGDVLADPGAGTLDDLLDRYADYSLALTDLYTALRRGAALDSREVMALLRVVQQAQAALPPDTSALRVAVNEVGGATVADVVLALERARGVVAQVVAGLP